MLCASEGGVDVVVLLKDNMSDNVGSRRGGGSFRERLLCGEDIKIKDIDNPWDFYHLFMSNENSRNNWCSDNNLLASIVKCPSKVKNGKNEDGRNIYEDCGRDMNVKDHRGKPGNSTFRCTKNRNHERGLRYLSYFENANITILDIMVFIKSYLDKLTLSQCPTFTGMSYKSMAVNWASFLLELFKEHFHTNIKERTIFSEIEIDKSQFWKKIKYQRGNPRPGLRIWIFWMVELRSNSIILYPVSDLSKETLQSLIHQHVAPGSTIYSDGWSVYYDLYSLHYEHFTVLHKYCFKKMYVNQTTNKTVVQLFATSILSRGHGSALWTISVRWQEPSFHSLRSIWPRSCGCLRPKVISITFSSTSLDQETPIIVP